MAEGKTTAKKRGSGSRGKRKGGARVNGGANKDSPSDRIISAMASLADAAASEGLAPWNPGRLRSAPRNGLTGRRYKGIFNLMNIFLYGRMSGYSDSRFIPIGSLNALAKLIIVVSNGISSIGPDSTLPSRFSTAAGSLTPRSTLPVTSLQ